MDLRQLATSETSALVERLTAAMAAEIEAATGRVQAAADAALAKLRSEGEQLRAALTKARTDEKTLAASLEKLRADDKNNQAALEKLRAGEKTSQAALEKLRADEAALRAALAKAKTDEKPLQAALEKARADQKLLQAAVDKARVDEKVLKATIEQVRAESKTLQATVEQLRGEEESLRAALEQESERAKAAEAAVSHARAEHDKMRAERDAIAREKARPAGGGEAGRDMRAEVLKLASAPIDHLRAGFHRLNAARSVDDVFAAFIEALGAEFSRVALFHVNGNRLEGRQQAGFDFASDISKVAVPLTKGSALAEAVRSARVQGLTASELTDTNRKLFGGSPTFVLILPVAIAGEIQAVVYADNSEMSQAQFSSPKRAVHVAEILLWHTIPLLVRLSAEERTIRELQEYGRQLLADLENVYASDVTAGFKGEKLQRRLAHNVEYARSMYTQRAQSAGANAAGVFDDELAALAQEKGGASFGRDLAAVAGLAGNDRKAEAS